MKLPILEPRDTRNVPCGTCRECCRNEAIILYPECGDDLGKYLTEEFDECHLMLRHKPNMDCIYLGPTGCTIHDRRPAICRSFDCRELLEKLGSREMVRLGIGTIAYAARRIGRIRPDRAPHR